jgi:hypothetical protein
MDSIIDRIDELKASSKDQEAALLSDTLNKKSVNAAFTS